MVYKGLEAKDLFSARLDYLAAASGGQLIGGTPGGLITGIFTDTRAPLRGGLYVALRGERFDGNSFARDAVVKLGAAAVLVDSPEAAKSLPQNAGAILVGDTRKGYLGIAAQHRQALNNTVLFFGVTGSVGKSTSKEMLAHILAHGPGWNVHKAKGSFNNEIGLSHTLLEVNASHRAAVLELGTNHPGEIRQLAAVARPNIALITCAGASHLEAFGSIENVAREKSCILDFQSASETAVLFADDRYFAIWRNKAKGRVISYGLGDSADVRARHLRINSEGCAEFMVRCGDAIADCVLQCPGVHQVRNALGAIAAAMAAGIPMEIAVRAIESFKGLARRFTIKHIKGITVIDDAYNANPGSFASALETLRQYHAARKFVVAGDMLELGTKANEYHRDLGQQIASCDLEQLFTVGPMALIAGAAAVDAGLPRSRWSSCLSPESAAQELTPVLKAGDAVLIKGSHGVNLDKTVVALESFLER